MQQLKNWFYALQPRERMVLGVGAIVALGIVIFTALVPFYASVNARAQRVAQKEADLAYMRSVGGDVMALSRDAGPMAMVQTGESLVVVVDRAARDCGLGAALTGQTPNGADGIRVRLERAEFDKLVVCLTSLQQGHAIAIESATIDRTSEPGFVNANLVLQRAAG
jgi:general secretion pathway protein M